MMGSGDHPSKPIETLPNKPEPAKRSKEVKEVHALVRNYLNKPESELANSSKYWRVLVLCWSKFQRGKFPACPTLAKVKKLAFK